MSRSPFTIPCQGHILSRERCLPLTARRWSRRNTPVSRGSRTVTCRIDGVSHGRNHLRVTAFLSHLHSLRSLRLAGTSSSVTLAMPMVMLSVQKAKCGRLRRHRDVYRCSVPVSCVVRRNGTTKLLRVRPDVCSTGATRVASALGMEFVQVRTPP